MEEGDDDDDDDEKCVLEEAFNVGITSLFYLLRLPPLQFLVSDVSQNAVSPTPPRRTAVSSLHSAAGLLCRWIK